MLLDVAKYVGRAGRTLKMKIYMFVNFVGKSKNPYKNMKIFYAIIKTLQQLLHFYSVKTQGGHLKMKNVRKHVFAK